MAKAHTKDDVDRIIDQWNAGVGPDHLHDALGWTPEEYRQWVNSGGEERERVLASFAPQPEPHLRAVPDEPDQIISQERTAEFDGTDYNFVTRPRVGEDAGIWHFARLAEAGTLAGTLIIDDPHGQAHAPWMFFSRWHTARVPGSSKYIVRSTASGVARLCKAPNEFDTYEAALRRADHLNSEEQHDMIALQAREGNR